MDDVLMELFNTFLMFVCQYTIPYLNGIFFPLFASTFLIHVWKNFMFLKYLYAYEYVPEVKVECFVNNLIF